MIRVTVEFWGPASDLVDAHSVQMSMDSTATVSVLRSMLMTRFSQLGPMSNSLRLAVNEEFAGENDPLRDGDIVAVIPPVSGG